MFSRFKKPDAPAAAPLKPVTSAAPVAPAANSAPRPTQVTAHPLPTAPQRTPAEAIASDKEKKRKDKMMEIKQELHKRLLDNLNLAALEKASEASLKSEIAAITA